MKFKHLIVACSLFISGLSHAKNLPSDIDFSGLEDNIRQTKKLSGLQSGTAIAVIQGDKIIYQGYFGYADIANAIAVKQDTPFYIASTTKPFMALNVLLDIYNKKLSPDLSLAQMFPALDIAQLDEQQIHLNDLMSHTSAIENLPLVLATAYSGVHNKTTLEQLVVEQSQKAKHEAGEFQYTNVGYNIYSVFADRYFDMPWQQRLQQQVFEPLNMALTSASMSRFTSHNIHVAKPYSLTTPSLPDALYLEKTDQTMHAAGGVISTSKDLAKFIIAQLNQGKVNGQAVFPAQVISAAQQKQVSLEKKYLDFHRDGYAWGWYTGDYKNQRMLHHFGGFAGFHSHMSYMPERKIGLVVLNNEDFLSAKMTNLIADYIYSTLLGEKDVQTRVEKRFTQLNQRLSKLDDMLKSNQQKLEARKLNLSHPIGEYQGEYVHPLLGTIKVTTDKEKHIRLQWGVLDTVAMGFDKQDHIRVTFDPTTGDVIVFEVSDKVKSLNYHGSTFKKVSTDT